MKWTINNKKIVSIDRVNSYMNFNMFLYVRIEIFSKSIHA